MKTRRDNGSLTLTFEAEEATLLRHLLDEMEALLRAEASPGEPITDRLFPQAYESPEDEAAFRELIGDQLKAEKTAAVEEVRTSLVGKEARLDEERAQAWLAVLTDLRLALGTRLEVTEEVMSSDIDPDDPNAAALSVLHWLGWVQESMLKELTD